MAFDREIVFEPLFSCNSSCQVTPAPSASVADHHHNHFRTTVVSVVTSVFFVFLILIVCFIYRRRQRPRRPLLPHAAAASFPPSDHGEEIHPVWYIRTVGLDEATIRSVAVAEYKAGDGLLDATYCSVCLGEFQDGELVRLLPKCSHAFHVPCIDTWLRAHVSCPLCRVDIVDPAGAASPPPASTTPAAISVQGSSSLVPTDNPNVGIQAPEGDHGGQNREEEDRGPG